MKSGVEMKQDDIALDKIKCPNCGAMIPVSETISHQIAERTREQLRKETFAQQEAITEKENELAEREALLDRTVEERVKAQQSQIKNQTEVAVRAAVSVELEDLRRQAVEKDQKLAEAQKVELELRSRTRALEDKERASELEIARRVDQESKRVREDTARTLTEEYRLKDAEKDKKLQDAIKANDELRRKLQQGSQQIQGEVLELQLETLIKNAFPLDQIEPVPKGIAGADVVQKVINPAGHSCGAIVWETKRTKVWNDAWLQKLKDDQRLVKADVAILLTEALPKDCSNFTQVSGVWVTNPQCAMSLAIALRSQLIGIETTKLAAVGKNEKMEVLYRYLSGAEFKQRVEAIVEAFIEMQDDLQEERRIAERRWSKREKQIQRVISNTSGMYGDLQGLIGSSLQSIPALTAGFEAHASEAPEDRVTILENDAANEKR
jgi:hypothetical protein